MRFDLVRKVVGADAVGGAHADDVVAEVQLVGARQVFFRGLPVVALREHDDDGHVALALFAQDVGHGVIARRQVFAAVDREEDEVRGFERDRRLRRDVFFQVLVGRSAADAARVEQQVVGFFAEHAERHVVARGAGDVRHDGTALAHEPVEQRGFARIRAADDRDGREFCHDRGSVAEDVAWSPYSAIIRPCPRFRMIRRP